jgi:hypothetical protein
VNPGVKPWVWRPEIWAQVLTFVRGRWEKGWESDCSSLTIGSYFREWRCVRWITHTGQYWLKRHLRDLFIYDICNCYTLVALFSTGQMIFSVSERNHSRAGATRSFECINSSAPYFNQLEGKETTSYQYQSQNILGETNTKKNTLCPYSKDIKSWMQCGMGQY